MSLAARLARGLWQQSRANRELRTLCAQTDVFCQRKYRSTVAPAGFKASTAASSFADPARKELRTDVKKLGNVLGEIIKEDDPKAFELVEKLRQLAKDFRRGRSAEAFEEMVATAKGMTAADTRRVARAFSHFLALSNCAETHHRVREFDEFRRETTVTEEAPSAFALREDSCRGAIQSLMDVEGLPPQAVREALLKQRVELVLTAHPTEVNRRTVIEKHRRIRDLLRRRDLLDQVEQHQGITEVESYERTQYARELRREIASLFFSDELRRFKPTVIHEAESALAIIESVLWKAVPSYLRKLDTELVRQLTARGLSEKEAGLPLTFAPIRFASWIGGDRDGNPNVTPETTLRVSSLNRWRAAQLYISDIDQLFDELSMSHGFSDEVRALSETLPGVDQHGELYRKILGNIRRRLKATVQKHHAIFESTDEELADRIARTEMTPPPEELTSSQDLLGPLMAIYNSLVDAGHNEIASGGLSDIIRRVSVFGLTIGPLDIRQESGRHLEAIDAITRSLGLGSYAQWDEDTKINWLSQELNNPRPLLAHYAVRDMTKLGFSSTVVDTLRTVQVASRLGEGSLGAYVISHARAASDVLAVTLLQQEFGLRDLPSAAGEGGNSNPNVKDNSKHMMRVVPLFESLNDLNNAPGIVERLLKLPAYTGRIGNRLEIMVGYSDSAKDAGRLAAAWAQYRCQEELANIAKKHGGVELTFFHGKGGTVGRGGSPAVYRAVLSHPPGTVDGRFRVTEQGETITQNFSNDAIAQRVLDVYTAAVLREKHHETTYPKKEWRDAMDAISAVSCDHYRHVVREDPNFVPYFRAVTPEQRLSQLNVGSRPAKRNPKGGIESLRAIPWIFAWSQTRSHLPAWLGVGKGLGLEEHHATLQEMYSEWPWFRELLDLIAMILAKADPTIVENYDRQIIPVTPTAQGIEEELFSLGKQLREELQDTEASVLTVSQKHDLYMDNAMLQRELEVRAPYLDALNVVQGEVMRRIENNEFPSPTDKEILDDTLLITLNGISAGLRNSG